MTYKVNKKKKQLNKNNIRKNPLYFAIKSLSALSYLDWQVLPYSYNIFFIIYYTSLSLVFESNFKK